MDWFIEIRQNVEKQLRSLSPVMRWASIGLVAAVLVGVASLWNHQSHQAHTYLFSEPARAGQLSSIEIALARAGLTDFVIEGRRIKVPADVKDRYLAALVDAEQLPRDFGEITQDAIDAGSPFDSSSQKAERLKNAKQRELAGIISEMKGIESARVLYDREITGGLRRAAILTASVSATPEGNRPLSLKQVRSIRNLVSSAIAGLGAHQVSVTDLNTGRNYAGEKITDAFSLREIQSEYKRTLESQWRQQIVGLLDGLPAVDATVDVSLRELPTTNDQPVDPQWQASAARIVVNVPRSYIERVWRQRNHIADDGPAPLTPSRDMAELTKEIASRLEKRVATVVARGVPLDFQMTLYDDVASKAESAGSGRIMRTSSLPGMIALLVVAFIGIVVLVSSSRTRSPQLAVDSNPVPVDEPAAPAEPAAPTPSPLDIDQRLKSAMLARVNEKKQDAVDRTILPPPSLQPDDERRSSWARADSRLVPRPDITGVELNDLAERSPVVNENLPVADDGGKAFSFLSDASAEHLLELLREENSQVIAVTFSQLDPGIAAEVLKQLPEALQIEVVRRMEGLDAISERVSGEIEESLQVRYAELMHRSQRRSEGQQAMKRILQATDTQTRRRITRELGGRHSQPKSTTAKTAPPLAGFDDVLALKDVELRRVIGAADPKDVVLALAGSDREVIDRVLENMRPRDARRLRRAFQAIDPSNISDVDGSQKKIAVLAARMHKNGRLSVTSVSHA